MTRFFILTDDGVEIQVDFTRREYNGIPSAPRIHTRAPSVDEIRKATAQVAQTLSLLPPSTGLIGQEPQTPV